MYSLRRETLLRPAAGDCARPRPVLARDSSEGEEEGGDGFVVGKRCGRSLVLRPFFCPRKDEGGTDGPAGGAVGFGEGKTEPNGVSQI
jgi:hypothetical protein